MPNRIHVLRKISELEKQNEDLRSGNNKLKHILYTRKFIDNPKGDRYETD